MKSYFVYVLKSKLDGNFYTGFTSDLDNRLAEHNNGKVNSTKNRIPFEIVYYEFCLCLEDAVHREKYLKMKQKSGLTIQRIVNTFRKRFMRLF